MLNKRRPFPQMLQRKLHLHTGKIEARCLPTSRPVRESTPKGSKAFTQNLKALNYYRKKEGKHLTIAAVTSTF